MPQVKHNSRMRRVPASEPVSVKPCHEFRVFPAPSHEIFIEAVDCREVFSADPEVAGS